MPAFSLTGNIWLDNLLAAVAAVLVALLVFNITSMGVRRLAGRYPIAAAFLDRTRQPARWLLVVVALQFVWEHAADQLPLIGAVRHATALGLISSLTWLGLRVISAFVSIVALLNPADTADNLRARRLQTQVNVLGRTLMVFIFVIGVSGALMTFPSVRQIGTSLLASAGVAGLVAGLAARPVLGNLIAGLQIALTQPIRLDDVLIVEGEWGRVEEITGAFVIMRLWDERRLVLPLQWFIEHPFQNWTRSSSNLIGTVFWWVDYRMPVEPLRAELARLCGNAPEWDGRVVLLQVVDASDKSIQLRALVSSADSSLNWDLRCRVREGLIAFIAREYPEYLPHLRAEVVAARQPVLPPTRDPAAPEGRAGPLTSST
jgi:small-conductance mechanosensitive channel